MGPAVFGTRCWPWTLIYHIVKTFQIHNVSPLLPYLPNFNFFLSLLRHTFTLSYFGTSLMWCTCLILYYIMSNPKLCSSKMICMRLFFFSPTLTIPALSDDAVKKKYIWIKSFLTVHYSTQLLLLMVIFKSVCIFV